MNYRLTQVLANTLLTDNRTDTYDINVKDVISRITLQYKATNGDFTPDGHPAKAVTKVELVDGSDVLYSLSAEQINATDFYDTGISPLNVVAYADANVFTLLLNLNFGRHLWDTNLALDPKRFKNLQLKVTHKVTNVAGSGCTTAYLTIFAHVFDEKAVTPQGFLMNKEVKSYVIGAQNSYEYTDLPTDYPMRRMMVQAWYPDEQPWQVVNEIKLSEDNDKRVIMSDKVSDYLKLVAPQYGRYHETIVLQAPTSKDDFFTAVGYEISVAQMVTNDSDDPIQLDTYPEGGSLAVVSNSASFACINVEGYAPHGCIPIFLGQQDDIADWYDVRKVGSLVMRLKAGSKGGTANARIITQQLRNY